jgi:hypothetical protein
MGCVSVLSSFGAFELFTRLDTAHRASTPSAAGVKISKPASFSSHGVHLGDGNRPGRRAATGRAPPPLLMAIPWSSMASESGSREIFLDGLRHGHFRCAISSVIGKGNRRDLVIEAGKSPRLCRHRRADELRSEPERCASSGRHLHGPDFQGVKSADLRIEQSVRIKLAINLKTEKSLGITLPTTLLARADEVIE